MNTDFIQAQAHDPQGFKELPLEEQLALIADITYYWASQKVAALKAAGKTRVDSCIEAQEAYEAEKYWTALNQNIKKLADLQLKGY